MDRATTTRPTLRAWLDEYASIERECEEAFEAQGVSFAPYGSHSESVLKLKETLRDRGACFLNGGASISTGFLSSACQVCVGDRGSRTFYINLRCNRGCYFCFNPNQVDYEYHYQHDAPWKEELDEFNGSCEQVTHIGLTGGEPMLCKEKMLAFFSRAHEQNPSAHLRLYTSGTAFDEAVCKDLADCGLREVRFSIKLDEGERAIEEVLRCIGIARAHIPDVMVEMPVIPGTLERMKRLLVELSDVGVSGINLLEFCYPMRDWTEFGHRGFEVKNPPFDVLYDYGYAGGLPIAGSEETCLELLLFAMDEGLNLGVHYCSLDNKNRDQILWQNRAANLDRTIYELDERDWFYKTAKVFDCDVAIVKRFFEKSGRAFQVEEEGKCLAFHPSFAAEAARLGAVVAISSNVVESGDGETYVRELKLELAGGVL